MDDRDDRDEQEQPRRTPRPANEGVRIIGAEEAAAALEKGEAAGRRPDDAPRFGDVPPQPAGPRPAHRFPLPDSVDPASAVPRPPVAPPSGTPTGSSAGAATPGGPGSTRPADREVERSLFAPAPPPPATPPASPPASAAADESFDADMTIETEIPRPEPEPAPEPSVVAAPAAPDLELEPEPVMDYDEPPERISLGGGDTELPHWTDPPTGEIPRALVTDETEAGDEAWAAASRAPRWRDGNDDWDEDFEMSSLADDDARLGALDTTRSEHSDLYDFDEPLPSGPTAAVAAPDRNIDLDDEMDGGPVDSPSPTRIRTRTRAGSDGPTSPSSGGADTATRVLTGLLIGAVALACFAFGTAATAVLATLIVTVCAFELYDVLRRAGYLPATLLGLVATVSIMAGTYWKGEQAVPLVLALVCMTTLLWYLFGVVRARPTVNVAGTLMVFVWVGVLGSFATLMLGGAPHGDGVGMVLAAVLGTVACDVGSYFAGHYFGSRPLMPEVSPKKTWEGALGGLTAAILVSAFITSHIHPWDDVKHAAFLGLVIGCIEPLGDLSESLIKRDIGVKDMSSVLPGHGGVFDRFDGLLFVLPATYYLAQYLKIH